MEEREDKLWNVSGDFIKHNGIYCPLMNPGNVSSLHEKPQRILAAFLTEGLEVYYGRNYGQNKGVSFSWILSQTAPSGCRIGGVYSRQSEDNILETPRIQVDVNPASLATNLDVLYHPIPALRLKLHYQHQPTCPRGKGSIRVEYIAPKSTSTLYVDNVAGQVSFLTLSHLHRVTQRWSLGAEVLLGGRGAKGMILNTAYAVRYCRNASTMAASFSTQALDISYWRQIHPAVQVGLLMAYSKQKPLIASLFYQWDFHDSLVRGMINSQRSVGFTYRRSFDAMHFATNISISYCIPTHKIISGFKLEIN